MKRFSILLPVIALAAAGCGGKSNQAALREQDAFLRGRQQAIESQQLSQQPAVWFRGLVRNPRVPWHENLTLAEAILAAGYTGALNPSGIRVIRQGQTYHVDPKQLLRGVEDPPLEPGDIVELTR